MAEAGGGEDGYVVDCPTDGSLDSAEAVASCSAAAMEDVRSFSFEGVIDLFALFSLGEGDGGESAMRLSGSMVLPDRIRYTIGLGPAEERVSISGVQIGMDTYVQDPDSGQWFKDVPTDADALGAIELAELFLAPIYSGASLEGTTGLEDGTAVYLLVDQESPPGGDAVFLSGAGTSMSALVGVADFLTRQVKISAATPAGESRDFILISYHGYNEAAAIEPPTNYMELPDVTIDPALPDSPVVLSLTRNSDGDVEVMFNEPVFVEGIVELYVLEPTTGGWGLPLLGGSGTDTLTFDADAEDRPQLVLGESEIAGFWFPDFDSNLVDAEGTSVNLNFDVWTYE